MVVGVRSWICLPLMVLMVKITGMVVLSVEDYSRADFPPDFVFGAGSSAYQVSCSLHLLHIQHPATPAGGRSPDFATPLSSADNLPLWTASGWWWLDAGYGRGCLFFLVEGAAFEDGRTPTIWDTFAHQGYYSGANGDVSCDQYHKYKEDVQLMVETCLEAYRFSISWSRLIPDGRGPVNPKGLEYYNNLINELIKYGIQPHVTLYHIDTPQALEDEYQGWLSRKILKDFTAYADVCFKEFGDRVLHWTTLNEPNSFSLMGYDYGIIPPGRCSLPFGSICPKGNSTIEPYIAVHNMLLAHSAVVKLYKKKYKAKQHGFVGINIFAPWFCPSLKLKKMSLRLKEPLIITLAGRILHPLVFGDYPAIIRKNAGTRMPAFSISESKLVKGSFDFVGLNHYYLAYIKDNPGSHNTESRDAFADMALSQILTTSNSTGDAGPQFHFAQNSQTPLALYGALQYIKQAYGNPPVYIHENGFPAPRSGTLKDTARAEYMHAYIGAVLDALRNGSNTKGYFLWSFLDCFELWDGYQSGFGLYYVDLGDEQLRRYPKLSARWYSKFLKGRSAGINEEIEVNGAFASLLLKASA